MFNHNFISVIDMSINGFIDLTYTYYEINVFVINYGGGGGGG